MIIKPIYYIIKLLLKWYEVTCKQGFESPFLASDILITNRWDDLIKGQCITCRAELYRNNNH